MEVTILAFGQIAEITGSNSWIEQDVDSTDALKKLLSSRYPGIDHIPYMVAINKKVVNENTALLDKQTIALLPPFSGG